MVIWGTSWESTSQILRSWLLSQIGTETWAGAWEREGGGMNETDCLVRTKHKFHVFSALGWEPPTLPPTPLAQSVLQACRKTSSFSWLSSRSPHCSCASLVDSTAEFGHYKGKQASVNTVTRKVIRHKLGLIRPQDMGMVVITELAFLQRKCECNDKAY